MAGVDGTAARAPFAAALLLLLLLEAAVDGSRWWSRCDPVAPAVRERLTQYQTAAPTASVVTR